MNRLRFTLHALLVSALLSCGACSKKQPAQGSNANAPADGAAQQQQHEGEPVSGDAREAFERGMTAYRADRDEDAVNELKRAVELDPDFAEAHYRLGNAYLALGDRDEAEKSFRGGVKAYEKITRRDEKNSDAFYFLGICYEKLGEYDDAVKALKEAVKAAPEDSQARDDKYYELAFAHAKLAQYDEAVRAANKALEINPNNYPAQDLLAEAKAGAERIADFRKHQQEQLRKQQKPSNSNSSNANSNAPRPTGTPKSDPLQPPPQD